MEKEQFFKQIETLMKAVQNEYISETELSWKEYTNKILERSAAPAAVREYLPEKGIFYDGEHKQRFNGRLLELKKEAMETVDVFMGTVTGKAEEEPPENAVRAVQMFSLIDASTIGAESYKNRTFDLLQKYGDNPLTYEAIRSHALKNGVPYTDIPMHPDTAEREAVRNAKKSIESFFSGCYVQEYETKKDITDGQIQFMLWTFRNQLSMMR